MDKEQKLVLNKAMLVLKRITSADTIAALMMRQYRPHTWVVEARKTNSAYSEFLRVTPDEEPAFFDSVDPDAEIGAYFIYTHPRTGQQVIEKVEM